MVRLASISAVTISPSEWFHWWLRGLEDHDSQKLTILRFLGSKTPGQIFGSLTFTNLCRFCGGNRRIVDKHKLLWQALEVTRPGPQPDHSLRL